MAFKQAERLVGDGLVRVHHNDDESLTVSVMRNGTIEHITLSEFNAARVFGMIGLMLGIPLTKAVGKAIKL